jgi:tripartite ATP-independent transporter DctP family solute receptor
MTTTFKSFVLASFIALGAVTAASAEVTLKLAHAAPDTDLQQNFSVFFQEQVAARTNGEVTVQIFPQGQLGNDAAMIDGTRSGIIDITMVGLNNFSGLMPESAAFTLPFMFPTRETAYAVLDGEVGQGVLAGFEAHGMKGLGYPENGYRNMTNNRGPIRTPADVVGLQMRVNNSKALNDMFAALGANPQQIPVAELYTALETGVVDSQDHPIGVTLSFKFYEVQDYLSLTQHAYSPLAVAMNLDKFNSLTADQQQVILDVAAEAVDMQRELSIAKEDEMIADLEANGMEVNRDVDGAAFQAMVKPVWDNFIAENGDALVNAIAAASN